MNGERIYLSLTLSTRMAIKWDTSTYVVVFSSTNGVNKLKHTFDSCYGSHFTAALRHWKTLTNVTVSVVKTWLIR